MNLSNLSKLIFALFISFLPGVIGSIFTAKNIYPWYEAIIKPEFTPPGWLFSPVWTTLYILMGLAFYFILIKPKSKLKTRAIVLNILQLTLNGFWPFIFFGQHFILGGLITIVALLILVILTAISFYKIFKLSGYLFIPYILWVSFATFLNYQIFIIN